MVKPVDATRLAKFDVARFKREHNKKHKVRDGFYDPITWIDTGNFALNKMISDDFQRGVPLGDVAVFAGESGSGKSYIVSGNIIRDALRQGIAVLMIDTENGAKRQWMRNVGVDPDDPNIIYYHKSTINHIAETIQEVMKQYAEDNAELPREQQAKLLIVIDSLGFPETEAEIEQFTRGELKGDKGIKAKMLKMLVSNCIRLFRGFEVGLVATNHTYKSQNMYDHDDVISGGNGFVFASSVIVSMVKLKLKTEGVAGVQGIRSKIKCVKSRYAKPFEEVEVTIPYDTGMDRYSGLFAMALAKGKLVKDGSRYRYTAADGSEIKLYQKEMTPVFFDRVMQEWTDDSPPPVADDAAADDAVMEAADEQ